MAYNTLSNFSEQEIKDICSNSYSYSEVAKKLGFSKNSGSASRYVKKYISEHNIDISHFKGKSWNKDNYDLSIFRNGNAIKSDRIIKILTFLRGEECEACHRKTWMGNKIPLCVHHIDGNHLNNELSNLQILCPNCHALTDNYCGRNKTREHKISDEDLVEALKNSKSVRQALLSLGINYSAKYYYEKAYKLMDSYCFSIGDSIREDKDNS